MTATHREKPRNCVERSPPLVVFCSQRGIHIVPVLSLQMIPHWKHPSNQTIVPVTAQIWAARRSTYCKISAATIPPIITAACSPLIWSDSQPITVIQRVQSPAITVTRQRAVESGSSPHRRRRRILLIIPLLCQHGRKAEPLTGPLTCSGAFTTPQRSENLFRPTAAHEGRVFHHKLCKLLAGFEREWKRRGLMSQRGEHAVLSATD